MPPSSKRPRVAFVVQRCGNEVNGGAELACLQVAQRLSAHWDTEVLTTCALDYMTWANHYPVGAEAVGSTRIRRFTVDQPRDVEHFNRLSEQLHTRRTSAPLSEQEAWMRAQGPLSSALTDYIRANRESYDLFIFFGYLYAQTYFNLPLVADRAVLAPLAHDEWPIYLSMWESFFALPKEFIFLTQEEKDFVAKRFQRLRVDGQIAALGVELQSKPNTQRFRETTGIKGDFLLYAGRIDPSKGCSQLFADFLAAKTNWRIPHKLVLVGRAAMDIPKHEDIIPLGFVSDELKTDAMAACDWLVMPSPHESFSYALLEAWLCGRPTLATKDSEVLVGHCRRSRGGLWYSNGMELAAALTCITAEEKEALGREGQLYVKRNYSWVSILPRYCILCEKNIGIA